MREEEENHNEGEIFAIVLTVRNYDELLVKIGTNTIKPQVKTVLVKYRTVKIRSRIYLITLGGVSACSLSVHTITAPFHPCSHKIRQTSPQVSTKGITGVVPISIV